MLVALYLVLTKWVGPNLIKPLFNSMGEVAIIIIGMVILFGALGFHISANMGSTISQMAGRAFRGIFRGLYRGVRWLILTTYRILRRVFNGTLASLTSVGVRPVFRNLIACLAALLVLAVII